MTTADLKQLAAANTTYAHEQDAYEAGFKKALGILETRLAELYLSYFTHQACKELILQPFGDLVSK